MKASSLVSILAGLAIVGTVAVKEFNKEEKLGKPFEKPASVTEMIYKNYSANLRYESGEISHEIFKIKGEFDKETNTLYLGNYTQNYNKEDWSDGFEYVPAYAKHTRINPFSKTFLLHPPEIKISKMEQRIYLVPQYAWDQNAKPYEKHENAQKLIGGGGKIINGVTGEIPIPFFKDFFKNWMKSADKGSKKKIKDITSRIKEGYTATVIPSYVKHKLVGSTETAREYKITFDTSQLKKESPVYLLTQAILGDPSQAPHGSFPHKYGKLETNVVEFELRPKEKTVVKKIELGMKFEDYLFQGKELESIKLIGKEIIGKEEAKKRNWNNLEKMGIIDYHFFGGMQGGFKKGRLYIFNYESEKAREKAGKSSWATFPKFFKDNYLMVFSEGFNIEMNRLLTTKQKVGLINLIFNYEKRIGAEMILRSNKKDQEETIKRMKKFLRKNTLKRR